MPICGYLVLTEPGVVGSVAARLSALPGCDALRAEHRDILLLVTDTAGAEEDVALRRQVERIDGVAALLLTFGDVDPERPLPAAPRDG